MKISNCFRMIANNLTVAPLVEALAKKPHLWDAVTDRQGFEGSPHKDTKAVFLRWGDSFDVGRVLKDVYGIRNRPEAKELKDEIMECYKPIEDLLGNPTIGRVMIVNLLPGGHIPAHIDSGAYADFYDRFHFVLSAKEGNRFRVGPHEFTACAGELWWFNHKIEHEVWNVGTEPRIHMIIDAAVPAYRVIRNAALEAA